MERIISGTDMKKVDYYTINSIGVPSMVLMERAAYSVTKLIEKTADKDKKVVVVAGTGNNGADGLAICRMLYLEGYNTCIYIMGDTDKATEEFKSQLNIVENLHIEVLPVRYLANDNMGRDSIVVDAIFGVGLSREVVGEYARVINMINECPAKVYSVDIPSGISSDNGNVMGTAIKADYTMTFGALKIGTILYPGAEYCGELSYDNIGFPEQAFNQGEKIMYYHTMNDLKKLPKRPNYSNKGTFGKLLIVAGSKDICGAAILCAKAAFRMGVGLVRIFTAKENREVIQKTLPEAMVNVYDTDKFDEKAFEACLNWADVVAVGPGISVGNHQRAMVEKIIQSRKKAVIDADGINTIAKNPYMKKMLHKEIVITPHLGEMARFENRTTEEIASGLIDTAYNANYAYNVNCVLKDTRTVIATAAKMFINMTGNSGMATAGSGDVLTGIIGGLLSVGMDAADAASMGPFIHGLAGDMAASKMPKASMMATDIIEEIKEILSYR